MLTTANLGGAVKARSPALRKFFLFNLFEWELLENVVPFLLFLAVHLFEVLLVSFSHGFHNSSGSVDHSELAGASSLAAFHQLVLDSLSIVVKEPFAFFLWMCQKRVLDVEVFVFEWHREVQLLHNLEHDLVARQDARVANMMTSATPIVELWFLVKHGSLREVLVSLDDHD